MKNKLWHFAGARAMMALGADSRGSSEGEGETLT
jgi:hypothetical protein